MSKGTTRRAVRIEDGLWEEAKEAAAERGDNLSYIMRQALWNYVHNHVSSRPDTGWADHLIDEMD